MEEFENLGVLDNNFKIVSFDDLLGRSSGVSNVENSVENPLNGLDPEGGDSKVVADKVSGDDNSSNDKEEGGVVKRDDIEKKEGGKIADSKVEGVVDNGSSVDYRSVLSLLSNSGVLDKLDDAEFEIDGNLVKFSDLSMDNPEQFVSIVKTLIESKNADLLKDKIDANGISDISKKLIEADKSGVDITSLIKTYDKIQAPIENLDLSVKENQLKVIWHYLSNIGIDEDEAKGFYKAISAMSDEEIASKALKYDGVIKDRMNAIIEKSKIDAEAERNRQAEDMKKYKKELKQNVIDSFQLNDKMVAKMIDYALKPIDGDARGFKTAVNEEYKKRMSDPKMAADLILFLMDTDEFIKQRSSNIMDKKAKKIFKLISSTPKSRTEDRLDNDGVELKGLPLTGEEPTF